MFTELIASLFGNTDKKVKYLRQGNIIILAKKLGGKKGVKHRCLIVSDVFLKDDSDIDPEDINNPDWVNDTKNQRRLAREVRAVGVTFSSTPGDDGISLNIEDFPIELQDCLGFDKPVTYLRISEPIEIRAGEVSSELCSCNDYLWTILCSAINEAGYSNHQVLTALENQCNCVSNEVSIVSSNN